MAIYRIKAQPLSAEAFAPYGSVIDVPTNMEPTAISDRFTFWPKVSEYKCDGGLFQIGVSTLYKRPLRTCSLERHYHTQEFMMPMNGSMIIVFAKHKGLDRDEIADYTNAEAFLITKEQGVVVNVGVWHWTPMPVDGDLNIVCSFGWDTEKNDVHQQDLPASEVIEVVL